MQLSAFLAILFVCLIAAFAVPLEKPASASVGAKSATSRARRDVSISEKRQPKARSGYIRFGKRRVDPNAELLYLDQLLL
ncbi:unnamed protein product [Caenorhabditis bovis]|uniref:Uncharacterized protein n=1 Tax=Caenorhabditis bovis TaxID=2654633 RepID=A0A8S1F0E3_9PELO|nr:unnamed protein product [Caenorhabditis bovis]